MNKKVIIILSIIVIIIISFMILFNKSKKTKSNENEINNNAKEKVAEIIQDEQTGEYIVYNKKNGEEIARGYEESSLYIYTIDPDYDPKLPMAEENLDNIE